MLNYLQKYLQVYYDSNKLKLPNIGYSMRIAIIGAGFSGLAAAWHLSQKNCETTLFDPQGIGGGASGISAGLVHPYAGAHAKLNRYGREGMIETELLLNMASESLGTSVVAGRGLIRLAYSTEQYEDFNRSAKEYDDIDWLSDDQCLKSVPFIERPLGGIFIRSALSVTIASYIKGLSKACESRGVNLIKSKIQNLSELAGFDAIIVAAGFSSTQYPELNQFTLTPIKGQILEFQWPKDMPMLSVPINSQAYLINNPSNGSCYAGATFEKKIASDLPDKQTAIDELFPKINVMVPFLTQCPIIDCRAGIRVSTPDHLPIIAKVKDNIWLLTGMGSKGLLYHALFAKLLAHQILNDKQQKT